MSVTHTPERGPSAGNRDDVLDRLASGVITVDEDGEIRFANLGARALFPLPGPVGMRLRTLLDLCGASNSREIVDAAKTRNASAPIRIGLADGRTLDARSRPLRHGGAVISLLDVTSYLHEAEVALHDPLTGLPNRVELLQRLTELLARAQKKRAPLAVLTVNLDRFKALNDTLGHPVGDALLVMVAERLRGVARKMDFVARLGGDEFAIVQAEDPQPQRAAALATRLVDLIGRTYIVSGKIINVEASVGVAISPEDGEDAETLLKHAGLAVDRSKSGGRDTFRFFRSSMDGEMEALRLLELDLRNALSLNELELAYQPQVRLEPYALVGFEALLRWKSKSRGVISPSDFIPMAEQIGIIVSMGEWVLRTACREAASWSKPASIAVNVSGVQFRNGKLVRAVTSALAASGLDPGRLELEITESVLLDDTDTVLEQLHALRALGARVAMDDFGTGFSSLTYLRKFPFDKIKIDQSFVRDFDKNPDCGAIVRAVTALGASLGITTIIEGVETAEELARVKAEGCNEVQGYFTGRPMPAAGVTALLAQDAALSGIPGQRS